MKNSLNHYRERSPKYPACPPPPFEPGEMDKNENKFPTRIHNGKSDIFFIYSEVIGTFCTINQHYH